MQAVLAQAVSSALQSSLEAVLVHAQHAFGCEGDAEANMHSIAGSLEVSFLLLDFLRGFLNFMLHE